MSAALLQQQLALLEGGTRKALGKSHSSKSRRDKSRGKREDRMAATELTINQKRRLLERSRAGRGKLSAQFLFCKTGQAETDVKARSLQQRKDLLRQAQADVASKSAAGLGADEKALLRFRQTSLSLLAYEDERSQADHTDSNLRLLLVSEALSKLS